MGFATALNLLRPTLPYYIALTKYGLLRIDQHSFELDPDPKVPALAVEMAKAVFTMGASSCTESYVISRTLTEGPKVFTFDAMTCEAVVLRRRFVNPLGLYHRHRRCSGYPGGGPRRSTPYFPARATTWVKSGGPCLASTSTSSKNTSNPGGEMMT